MGDAAWRLRLPSSLDGRALLQRLKGLPGVIDAVVCEEHAVVTFDPHARPDDRALHEVVERTASAAPPGPDAATLHLVRVRYDGEDLEEVSRRTRLPVAEVIATHSTPTYVVATIGFLPGFGYLRGLDPRLVVPRRDAPRLRVPALSVAMAGPYTGVYPFVSPGGWHLLGTAVDFSPFDVERGAALALGDRVRFVPEQG